MDRSYLYKTTTQTKKVIDKENVNRVRSKSRAEQQDAQRGLKPGVETVQLPHLERLKLWCKERDKKKQMAEQLKGKSSDSPAMKTNMSELNSQRRNKILSKHSSMLREPIIAVRSGVQESVRSPSHAEVPSVLNVTFDKETSMNTTFETDSPTLVAFGTEAVNPATPKSSSSLSNVLFKPSSLPRHNQSNKRRKTWSKNGEIHKLELTRSVEGSPPVSQNKEAANYFRVRVEDESKKLMDLIQRWTDHKAKHGNIDSSLLGEIDVAIAQSTVLIDQKFKVFLEMCQKCDSATDRPPVRPSDLDQFWRTTFAEVEESTRKFERLAKFEVDLSISAVDVSKPEVTSTVRRLRQTPMRLAHMAARQNTSGTKANPKSESPQVAASPSTSKSKVTKSTKRRKNTTRILSEEVE